MACWQEAQCQQLNKKTGNSCDKSLGGVCKKLTNNYCNNWINAWQIEIYLNDFFEHLFYKRVPLKIVGDTDETTQSWQEKAARVAPGSSGYKQGKDIQRCISQFSKEVIQIFHEEQKDAVYKSCVVHA